ncbi:MAG: hypothetical protein AAGD14_02525 [Planctomycetota bacterium]
MRWLLVAAVGLTVFLLVPWGATSRTRGAREETLEAPDAAETKVPKETGARLEELAGVVVDLDGTPAVACKLEVRLPQGDRVEIRTDHAGRFRVDGLQHGFASISIEDERWIGPEESEYLAGSQLVRLVVRRKGWIRGRVLERGGAPAAGAGVHDAIRATVNSDGVQGYIAATTQEGTFEFAGAVGERLTIFANLEGRRSASIVAAFGETDDCTLTLSSEATHRSYVHLHVVDEEEAPIQHAEVRWSRHAYLPPGARRNANGTAALPPLPVDGAAMVVAGSFFDLVETTDQTGRCSLSLDLPPGTRVDVSVAGGMFERRPPLPAFGTFTTTARSNDETHRITMRTGVRRRIRLIDPDDGNAVTLGLVMRGPAGDAQGVDDIKLVTVAPNEPYDLYYESLDTIVLLARGWQAPVQDVLSEFEASRKSIRTLVDAKSIRFRLRGAEGTLLPGVWCRSVSRFDPVGTSGYRAFRTFGDGEVETTPARGTYLRLESKGHGTKIIAPPEGDVRLEPGGTLRVVIRLPGRWRILDWRLDVEANGWPFPVPYRFWIDGVDRFRMSHAIALGNEKSLHWFVDETLPSGAFGTLADLPPGPCRLRLFTDGYEQKIIAHIEAGKTVTATFR